MIKTVNSSRHFLLYLLLRPYMEGKVSAKYPIKVDKENLKVAGFGLEGGGKRKSGK